MSIQEDYLKASEGGHHLAREKLRHDVIIKRLDVCLSSVSQVDALQPGVPSYWGSTINSPKLVNFSKCVLCVCW